MISCILKLVWYNKEVGRKLDKYIFLVTFGKTTNLHMNR